MADAAAAHDDRRAAARATCRCSAARGSASSAPTTSGGTEPGTRTGSPGESIPLGARIFAVADALDAMTDRRPYRRPLRWEAALARIRKAAGTQFDPDVVDGFVACEPELYRLHMAELAA